MAPFGIRESIFLHSCILRIEITNSAFIQENNHSFYSDVKVPACCDFGESADFRAAALQELSYFLPITFYFRLHYGKLSLLGNVAFFCPFVQLTLLKGVNFTFWAGNFFSAGKKVCFGLCNQQLRLVYCAATIIHSVQDIVRSACCLSVHVSAHSGG